MSYVWNLDNRTYAADNTHTATQLLDQIPPGPIVLQILYVSGGIYPRYPQSALPATNIPPPLVTFEYDRADGAHTSQFTAGSGAVVSGNSFELYQSMARALASGSYDVVTLPIPSGQTINWNLNNIACTQDGSVVLNQVLYDCPGFPLRASITYNGGGVYPPGVNSGAYPDVTLTYVLNGVTNTELLAYGGTSLVEAEMFSISQQNAFGIARGLFASM
jgi:hypothetical protein